jgi:hypothetical protein
MEERSKGRGLHCLFCPQRISDDTVKDANINEAIFFIKKKKYFFTGHIFFILRHTGKKKYETSCTNGLIWINRTSSKLVFHVLVLVWNGLRREDEV